MPQGAWWARPWAIGTALGGSIGPGPWGRMPILVQINFVMRFALWLRFNMFEQLVCCNNLDSATTRSSTRNTFSCSTVLIDFVYCAAAFLCEFMSSPFAGLAQAPMRLSLGERKNFSPPPHPGHRRLEGRRGEKRVFSYKI